MSEPQAEPAVAWSRLFDALTRVEDVEQGDCGLLAFGVDPDRGGILVENGRICWAVAPGMQRRLKDLLVGVTGRAIDFDRIYERCRSEGRLFGQTLVDDGWVSASELEVALRRHSAESLVELCRLDDLPIWKSRGHRGYLPRFTFRPIDVLLEIVNLSIPELQAAADREIARIGAAGRGGAFCCDEQYQVMVPVATFGDLTVHELRALGRWAMLVPLASRELGISPEFTLAATATGETFAVWWRGPVVYAVACGDRSSLAALTARLSEEGA